jgi:hypothetical protein
MFNQHRWVQVWNIITVVIKSAMKTTDFKIVCRHEVVIYISKLFFWNAYRCWFEMYIP